MKNRFAIAEKKEENEQNSSREGMKREHARSEIRLSREIEMRLSSSIEKTEGEKGKKTKIH